MANDDKTEDFDTSNNWLVTSTGRDSVQILRRDYIVRPFNREQALSLVAWVSVMAGLTDEEIERARRAVEGL